MLVNNAVEQLVNSFKFELQVPTTDQVVLPPLWNSFVGTGIHNGPVPRALVFVKAQSQDVTPCSYRCFHTHAPPRGREIHISASGGLLNVEACSGAMGTAAEDVGAMEPDAVDANRGDLDRCRVAEKPIIK